MMRSMATNEPTATASMASCVRPFPDVHAAGDPFVGAVYIDFAYDSDLYYGSHRCTLEKRINRWSISKHSYRSQSPPRSRRWCLAILFALLRGVLYELPDVGLNQADLGEDVLGCGGPDERFGGGVA